MVKISLESDVMTSHYKVSALTYVSRRQTTRVICISNSIWVITSNQLLLILHPFNGLFSRTTWVSQYQKGKTSVDLNEARYDGVLGQQWHQLDHMQTICTSLQTDNHTNTSSLVFTGRMPFLTSNQQRQSSESTDQLIIINTRRGPEGVGYVRPCLALHLA